MVNVILIVLMDAWDSCEIGLCICWILEGNAFCLLLLVMRGRTVGLEVGSMGFKNHFMLYHKMTILEVH